MTAVRCALVCLAALSGGLAAGCAPHEEATLFDPRAHAEEVAAWRREREAALRADDGWLSLAGLFWLEEGDNTFGSSEDCDLVFPSGRAPALAGTLTKTGDKVRLTTAEGAVALVEGEPVASRELLSDASGSPTIVELGRLLFYVVDRGGRLGIRLKDRDSPVLAAFSGMESFAIDPAWRLVGRFEAYPEPHTVAVPNILGTSFDELSPGRVHFEVAGRPYTLEPTGEPGGELFFVFGDETNGKETYGGGRFLYADWPESDGRVVLDFNKAYNPPCVFTPWATCPLPTAANRLPFRIEAGELAYAGAPGH